MDDRRAWLELIAYDASNNIVFQSGVVPDDKDPEEITDAQMWKIWDFVTKDDETPAHFFWDVANEDPSHLIRPPVTLNQNDFTKALKRIDAETSDYYVIGYYTSNPDPLKRRRRVEVKVNRPNAELRYRTEYTLKPTKAPAAKTNVPAPVPVKKKPGGGGK